MPVPGQSSTAPAITQVALRSTKISHSVFNPPLAPAFSLHLSPISSEKSVFDFQEAPLRTIPVLLLLISPTQVCRHQFSFDSLSPQHSLDTTGMVPS